MQMEPDEQIVSKLLHWLLHEAPPVKRCDLLTRLGRLPPRPLGAALFTALLDAGQLQDALRLVRHAEGLSDLELEAVARAQLVAKQVGCRAAGRSPMTLPFSQWRCSSTCANLLCRGASAAPEET